MKVASGGEESTVFSRIIWTVYHHTSHERNKGTTNARAHAFPFNLSDQTTWWILIFHFFQLTNLNVCAIAMLLVKIRRYFSTLFSIFLGRDNVFQMIFLCCSVSSRARGICHIQNPTNGNIKVARERGYKKYRTKEMCSKRRNYANPLWNGTHAPFGGSYFDFYFEVITSFICA